MSIIEKSIENHILTLTINRPKALNALNQDVIEALKDIFVHDSITSQSYKGIILTGSGEKAFAAGADIKEFTGLDAQHAFDLSQKGKAIFNAIEGFHKPVIAAINGFALGGGLELAMACHIRIASENAKFALPEVSLGIIPGYSGTQRLPQLVGKGRALSLALTGDMIDAKTALEYGLITEVVSLGNLITTCEKVLGKIFSKGPLAIKNCIQSINAQYDSLRDGDTLESEYFGELAASEDFIEGVNAFIEKRKANFKGN